MKWQYNRRRNSTYKPAHRLLGENGSKHVVVWYNEELCVCDCILLFVLIVTPTGMNEVKILHRLRLAWPQLLLVLSMVLLNTYMTATGKNFTVAAIGNDRNLDTSIHFLR
jgi:hypothetical protein